MLKLETVHELAEDIADKLGIYGCGVINEDHPNDCECRICFVSDMEDRIITAVENDKYLKNR